nr:hypothetical protein [Vibrio anguillarum]
MNLKDIIENARDMKKFENIEDYIDFSKIYLNFIAHNIQAEIVSRNENNYRFLQYKKDGTYNVTR